MLHPMNRRELLRIGSLSLFGVAFGPAAKTTANDTRQSPQQPDRSCIFMLLQGGPSHIDLWDPKPQAPVEVRGPFNSIDTSLPGLRLGELLTQTAKIAHHLAVVRSATHEFNNHIAGTYITLTGSTSQRNVDREAHGDDFPGPGAVLNYLQTASSKLPASISLPNWLSIPGPSNRMPGQYGGFLGATKDPFVVSGDPNKSEFKPLSLTLPEGFGNERMQSRWTLLEQLNAASRKLEKEVTAGHDNLHEKAYELLLDPRLRTALDLSKESDATRDRYGRTKIGQSLLLARRLVEAGIKFVEYNAFNQEWDTHGGLLGRYKELIPPTDLAYSALIEDLAARGLLDKTLVIHTGEFGRTPLINKDGGRDHWPNAYSMVLAGGGIRGGQVLGATDNKGASVVSQAVSPADMLATMWHLLGIGPATELRDRLNRPQVLSHGRVVTRLI